MTHLATPPAAASPVADLPGLEFAPGTNPNGDLSFADWRFLLPRLRHGTVLFLGAPPAPVVAALARTADRVVVATPDPATLRRVRDDVRARGLVNVHALCTAAPARLPCADGAVGLLVPWGRRMTSRVLADAAFADELARILAPDGTIYLELHHRLDLLRARRWGARLGARGFDAPRTFWLLPRERGGIRLALPVEQRGAARYAFDHVLHGTSRRAATLRLVGRVAARAGLHGQLVPSRALVVQRRAPGARGARGAGEGSGSVGPSGYIAELGARAGVELGRLRPGFFARGTYDSNKVAFFLFGEAAREPSLLLKLTRAPRYNHRLEAEYRALDALRERGLAEPGSYPEALFLDRHHDLAVLAQRVVHGAPLRTRTRGDATCPLAHAALGWIAGLGARSAAPPDDPATLPRTLGGLLARFADVYALDGAERDYLQERIAALAAVAARVPTVFQHGDAGTWNVLATGADRVAFLDWEVSTERGVPLWDLVDFLRSFGSWVARGQGEHDMVRAYARHFLAPGPLAELQAAVVRGYCARVGLPRESVEALFLSCWMQRAVREAAWTSRPLEEGSYVNLVRTCIRRRDAEGLRWLCD